MYRQYTVVYIHSLHKNQFKFIEVYNHFINVIITYDKRSAASKTLEEIKNLWSSYTSTDLHIIGGHNLKWLLNKAGKLKEARPELSLSQLISC